MTLYNFVITSYKAQVVIGYFGVGGRVGERKRETEQDRRI